MPPRQTPRLLPLLLLVALAIRVAFALRKGLVLDEFHSLFHATRAGLGPFFTTLVQDNHPPLSFLLIGASARAFGRGELALRLPALLCAMVELVLVARLARRLGPGRAALAAALVAGSTLHLDWSTQARMYACLSLAITGLTLALVEHLEGAPGRRRWMVSWVVFGLHCHYFTAHYVLVLGAGVLALAALDPGLRVRVRALIPAAALALALCAPWLATGFRRQLAHALPPGGDDIGLPALLEALVHLFFLNVRFAGPARAAFLVAGGLLLLLAAWGLVRELRDDRRRALLLGCAAFGTPLAAAALALAWPRAGFTWNYVLPSLAPMAVLAAAGTRPGALALARRAAAAYGLAAMAALVGLHLASRGTEDYPGAVRRVLELHRPGDLVVSVEFQPRFFPQGQPWDYYAPRLAPAPPARVAMNRFDLADPRPLREARRVLVLVSKLPAGQGVRRRLEREFELRAIEEFGFGRAVLVYERP